MLMRELPNLYPILYPIIFQSHNKTDDDVGESD